MGNFGIDEATLQGLYHRAWLQAGKGYVDFKKYPYLYRALQQYASENDCSIDDAMTVAKTGTKFF